jgi:hypothetical protein
VLFDLHTRKGTSMRLRVSILRAGVSATLLLASALGAGWKWDGLFS